MRNGFQVLSLKQLRLTNDIRNPLKDGRKRDTFHAATIKAGTRLEVKRTQEDFENDFSGKVVRSTLVRTEIRVHPSSHRNWHDRYAELAVCDHWLEGNSSEGREKQIELLSLIKDNSEEIGASAADWLREHGIYCSDTLAALIQKGKVSREDVLAVHKELEEAAE